MLLALLVSCVVFLIFQISSQMLVYKRHMVHLAHCIREIDEHLVLQWDLTFYSKIYLKMKPSEVDGVVWVAFFVYVPLFLSGYEFVAKYPLKYRFAYTLCVFALWLGGLVLLGVTRKRIDRAYVAHEVGENSRLRERIGEEKGVNT